MFARSPVAHGRINSIDTSEAEGMPGVIAVHTAASLALEPQPSDFNPAVARTLLASDKVRWVGEPIAAIVAETYEQATDAAQTVSADFDPLPALIDIEEALSFEGESGPYLQYATVRANNIFAKLRDREGVDEAAILGALASTPAAALEDEVIRPAVGTLSRTKTLLLAALKVWELKNGIRD